ncbi:MAG: FtsX-like permease family protein [Burkholderiales bacterium]
MRLLPEMRMALRLLIRDFRAGELMLIGIAVVIAVAGVTTVGFFTDRVQLALNRQANQLLGADLVVSHDRALPTGMVQEAQRRQLAVTQMLRFPSMAVRGDKNVLADIKVVSAGYPLRGEVRIADKLYGEDRRASTIPAPGSVWVDERILSQLNVSVGEKIVIGNKDLEISAVMTQEPDAAIGFINAGPRVMVNEADLAATGLVQTGSRIRYRLQIAGNAEAIDAYRDWVAATLQPGQRIEGIRDARPEIRSALERAEKFLNIAALVSVLLAAMAIALAARRFLQRHLDACAMMRCLGASQGQLMRMYLMHFAVLGLAASVIGCAIGALAQQALAHWLGTVVAVDLPQPSALPLMQGLVIGLALLLGFALPPIIALGRVPTMRVLRRDLGTPDGRGVAGYLLGYAIIAGMIFWKASDFRLGMFVVLGFTGAMLAAGALAWLLLKAVSGLRNGGISWRFGIANLRRHPLGTIVQVIALGLGLMALLTLTLIRNDLLSAWQTSLPPDAPNRFLVNIQDDQVAPLKAFFAERQRVPPLLHPMIRGRLVQINGRGVSAADFADERAKRQIEREFNLSWAASLPKDNRIVAGQWWPPSGIPREQYSMEDGIAQRLGVKLGDRLTFDIAGTPVSATVTSLRKVDWDSFNVNFFMIAPQGLLEKQPVSYVTSFHLPSGKSGNNELLNALIKQFPNLLVIDVAQVMAQVQKMITQVSKAIQFVFLFTLLAGLVVFYAAIASTQDDRMQQAAIMRTLGASRAQLTRAHLAEFAVIGALAGLIAAAGASSLGYVLAVKVLNVSYNFSPLAWLAGVACGGVGIAIAGYLGTRRVLATPPMRVLRELA